MTREKAIETLSIIKAYEIDNSIRGAEYREAIDMAIQALEQEPCEDAISRSDAIRVASGYCHWSNIPDELAKLPSVNPKPCGDAISRQAAIDAMSNALERVFPEHRDIAERTMNKLPSVSTEKTGRWIRC